MRNEPSAFPANLTILKVLKKIIIFSLYITVWNKFIRIFITITNKCFIKNIINYKLSIRPKAFKVYN